MTVVRTDVIKLRESGLTLREIGSRLGVSAERVRQVLKGKTNNRKTIISSFDPPLSTSDVARLLNIHTNTVRRWSTNGTLKTYRVGPRGDRRFKRTDIEKLLEKATP
jgi:excisionase family DNA binding protein